ncbi:MAG: hypothetical protein ABWZ67_01735, partial [Solirubrobacteraceae bacterium]
MIAADGSSLDTVLPARGRAYEVRLVAAGAAQARIETSGPAEELAAQVRHMLRLDDDLSAFYARAAEDPDLAWAARGAGRLLRSPT